MNKVRLCASEFVGTFLLIFIGVGSISSVSIAGSGGLLAIALAFGLAVAVIVAAIGHVSGAHINPAVTTALFVSGKIKLPDAILYVLSQLAAAVVAALALRALLGPQAAAAGVTHLNHISALQGVVIEAVLTFFLVFVIFGTAVDMRAQKLPSLFIGLIIVIDIVVGGPFTGASMNPARSFGPALVSGMWQDHWIYWVGPIFGGAAAAMFYTALFLPRGAAEAMPDVRPDAPKATNSV
ncbi:MAG TPA: MIP family channel protein [Tepidisphaeraceae bacterium]|nr:MIP family channel protein [Tepidisphaeraceae bacterium]